MIYRQVGKRCLRLICLYHNCVDIALLWLLKYVLPFLNILRDFFYCNKCKLETAVSREMWLVYNMATTIRLFPSATSHILSHST